MKSRSNSYTEAGVDINAGYKAIELITQQIKRTETKGVIEDLGGFSGLFMPDLSGMNQPVLVSGTDGVGTKLKLAFISNRHDTIGIDAVAMSVNDVICCGAKPLFFLDYIATGKLNPEVVSDIVKGVADGCVMAECALIGGETAEMPDFYSPDEYDLAGFAVGIIDREKIVNKENTVIGDTVIGLASNGFHSNGFSLIRKIFAAELEQLDIALEHNDFLGESLLDALLRPTTIYVKPIMALQQSHIRVNGISHITGGGFYENIPRCLPEGMSARIERSRIPTPKVIQLLQQKGNIPDIEMFSTFNMGIGMVVVVSAADTESAVEMLNQNGANATVIGTVVQSDEGVELW
ncbi:MAG: phosphoribosylformylglycinamidine cyclo-ligase [Oscillospiraceae bacterium]|nr:phosphoribosylformylglycinamidine cyclo-ligase [Oscillospiraceae bacterium]